MKHRLLSAQQDKKHVDVAGRDTGDAACLCQRFGVYLDELLPGFGRKRVQVGIVEASFYLDAFQPVYLVGYHPLAVDVAVVLDEHFGGFEGFLFPVGHFVQFGLEGGDVWRDIPDGDLRAAQQVD